jgi:hypothetical protein
MHCVRNGNFTGVGEEIGTWGVLLLVSNAKIGTSSQQCEDEGSMPPRLHVPIVSCICAKHCVRNWAPCHESVLEHSYIPLTANSRIPDTALHFDYQHPYYDRIRAIGIHNTFIRTLQDHVGRRQERVQAHNTCVHTRDAARCRSLQPAYTPEVARWLGRRYTSRSRAEYMVTRWSLEHHWCEIPGRGYH